VNANINLASTPFTNRALPWILTVVILFVSLVALVLVVQWTTTTNRSAAQIEAEVNLLKQKEQSLISAAESVKAALTPEQRLNLRAAHELVDRKGFSWSRLLADLESALPDNIRVSRIAVRGVVSEGNQTIAQLELDVFSKSSTTVTEMINAMDRQGIFHADLRNQNLQKGRGESGTEYELDVVYRPRAGVASESVAEVREQTKSNEVPR
jgi:Tfp pilus assembly protein PilN